MPPAQPLPRKHLATIRDAIEELRVQASRIVLVLDHLDEHAMNRAPLQSTMQEIHAAVLTTALHLTDLEIAGHCDERPAAPARTSAQIQLEVLNDELLRLARLARQGALGNTREEPDTPFAPISFLSRPANAP